MSSSYHLALNAAHAAVLGPAFLYVGMFPESVPDAAYTALLVAGAAILFYHAYLAYQKLKDGKSAWVNWIHIFLVAPLLMIVGYMKKETHRRFFEMLLMLGFAAIGYHGLYLIRETMLA
jgi:hypothetical protein